MTPIHLKTRENLNFPMCHIYIYIYIYIYICHRQGIGDKEKMMGLCVMIVIVNFGNDAGECTDKLDVSSAHAQWFFH